jgi:hypothetical protein
MTIVKPLHDRDFYAWAQEQVSLLAIIASSGRRCAFYIGQYSQVFRNIQSGSACRIRYLVNIAQRVYTKDIFKSDNS